MRRRWLLYLAALLLIDGGPVGGYGPYIPPRAGKNAELEIQQAFGRSAQLDDAMREDGVYEPRRRSGGGVRRALRRLRSAVAHPRK